MATLNMFAPAASQAGAFIAKSGNSYTPNAQGVLTGVVAGDIDSLQNQGCVAFDAIEQSNVLPWVTGSFYGIPPGVTPTTGLLTVASTMYAYPLYIPNKVTVATLALDVSTGVTGGSFRIGIYADLNGRPSALIFDSGAGSAASTAIVTITPATGPTITPGWYWIATQFTASSTMPNVFSAGLAYTNPTNQIGYDTAAHAFAASAEALTGLTATFTFGAYPAVFPGSPAVILNAACPLVVLGV